MAKIGYASGRIHASIEFLYVDMTLAGTPTAIELSGISDVTTEPAPMTQCRPMLTFGKITV
jgi:hypothetical protein